MAGRRRFEAVVFDVDGVITDTAGYHETAWRSVAEDLGVSLEPEIAEHLKGLSRRDSLDLILKHGGIQLPDAEKDEVMARKNDAYVGMLENITPRDVLPGIKRVIEDLRAGGIRTAVASASRNAPTVIDMLGLAEAFDAIADPAGLPGKPAPDLFLEAARLVDADPHGSAGIEDAVAGVQAINSAGMFAVAIGRDELFPHADLVFPNTQALADSGIFANSGPR